jgi:hypothetical protein
VFAANRTLRIFPQLELSKLHRPGIKQQQPINENIFRAENDLNRFVCLDCTNNARQNSEHASLGA